MNRFIYLSGPSCVGKGPLYSALSRFYPELTGQLKKLILHNSRRPRPHEQDGVDYHFRSQKHIETLKNDRAFIVKEIRGDYQAMNVEELPELLQKHDLFFEGNPAWLSALRTHPDLKEFPLISVFLSPLNAEEIDYLQRQCEQANLQDFITELMRTKLLRRTRHQREYLSLKDLENIETRAGLACDEIKQAVHFDWVIPNHDGEDSEHWSRYYHPIGDARKALFTFVDILYKGSSETAEKWDDDLFNP